VAPIVFAGNFIVVLLSPLQPLHMRASNNLVQGLMISGACRSKCFSSLPLIAQQDAEEFDPHRELQVAVLAEWNRRSCGSFFTRLIEGTF
jgi:hypothetical protein